MSDSAETSRPIRKFEPRNQILGRKLETTGTEVLKAIHPHPTMSEAVMEAVAAAYDEVIHL